MKIEYHKVKACELCGKKFWKGYFVSLPSSVTDFNVTKVVCWRCRFLRPIKEILQTQSKPPKA